MTRIVIVRHGETVWNRDGRAQGWAPVKLTENGREQARKVGHQISEQYDPDIIYSSDLHRARETTDLILNSLGKIPINFDSAWRERSIGIYQGLTFEEIDSRFPEIGLTEYKSETVEQSPEGGESLRTMQQRVIKQFETIAESHKGTILVVTHASPVQVLLAHVQEIPLIKALKSTHLDNCDLIEFKNERGEIEFKKRKSNNF